MSRQMPPAEDGFSSWELESWDEYIKLFCDESGMKGRLSDAKELVFRGQRNPKWEVVPTLNRHFQVHNRRFCKTVGIGIDSNVPPSRVGSMFESSQTTDAHLDKFKKSIRGKTNFQTFDLNSKDKEIWAIGQHYGLATPLLDWTTSPFVAAFFAFEESKKKETNEPNHRAVYALDKTAIEELGLSCFEPEFGENSRLIAQSGLFVEMPIDCCLESLVKSKFKGNQDKYILIKILIPDTDRDGFLKLLNRFNINHLSLFPDLVGASKYCNLSFEIDDY